jgi:outer membrane protein TolC
VSINLPIFTSLINETDLKTTRYAELTAEFELERVEDEVRQRALEAWNSYQCASQRLTGASALVLEAQEALAIAEITYQAGSITRLDLEQSILGLTSARESRSEALLAMRMAELNIAMLSGEIHEIWEVE